jgi:hypothetical protein
LSKQARNQTNNLNHTKKSIFSASKKSTCENAYTIKSFISNTDQSYNAAFATPNKNDNYTP